MTFFIKIKKYILYSTPVKLQYNIYALASIIIFNYLIIIF